MLLKGQLSSIQAVLNSCQGLTGTAGQLANMPIMTPTGPVQVPALPLIINSLAAQNELSGRILKFLDTVITLL
jgi:hypothetical protein